MLQLDQCETAADCEALSECLDGLCRDTPRVGVTDHIVEDTTWTADNVYVLENLIFVVPPAVLTIEPGTTILGRRNIGLVSLAGARIEAVGTRQDPIVFTSDRPVGQRVAGDWAGLGLVGLARTNREGFQLRITVEEGLDVDTRVGGNDDSWNCGTLRYVRVEFGGSEIDGRKALNGITLAGCGSDTTVEYVQSHMSDDDGIAVFGGTVDIRYAVSTRARDDAFDMDTAWRGTAQFLAAQFDISGQESFEFENLAEDPSASPQTFGQVYNFTLIGADRTGAHQVGLYNKFGGQGHFSHGIVQGFGGAGLYVEGPEAAEHTNNGLFTVENTLFFDNGPDGDDHFAMIDPEAGEDAFVNYGIFEDPETGNRFGLDPGMGDPYNLQEPDWQPAPQNVTGVDPPPEGFDPTAVYLGAFSPSATPWTEGWTSYPPN